MGRGAGSGEKGGGASEDVGFSLSALFEPHRFVRLFQNQNKNNKNMIKEEEKQKKKAKNERAVVVTTTINIIKYINNSSTRVCVCVKGALHRRKKKKGSNDMIRHDPSLPPEKKRGVLSPRTPPQSSK